MKPQLKGLAKALYSAVQVLEAGPDRLVLGVPNAPHQARCEQERPAVQQLLARAAGRPIEVVLVVADDGGPRPAQGRTPVEEEMVDPDELVDAPRGDVAHDPVDRLTRAFPGAELLEES